MGHSGAYFVASATEVAQAALTRLIAAYGQAPLAEARVVVPLGGDGFMLQTLGAREFEALPVYGMNCGTIGFLMNEFSEAGLVERIAAAEEAELHQEPTRGAVAGEVFVVEDLGNERLVTLDVGGQFIVARMPSDYPAEMGQRLWLSFDQERAHLFDAETQRRID